MSAARACAAPSHRGLPAKQKSKLLEFVQLIDQMRTTCAADVDVADVRAALSHILEATDYYEHLQRTYDAGDEALKKENIEQLLDRAAAFDQTDLFEASDELHARLARLKSFVDSLRDGDGENRKEAPDVIFLSTVHQAKGAQVVFDSFRCTLSDSLNCWCAGMEFDYVFVVRFNEGMMPLSARGSVSLVDDDGSTEKSADDCEQQLQEERRLAYVACSRAKLQLHLSFILTDFTGATCQPSRFLGEIPESTTDAQSCKSVEAEPPKDMLSVFTSKSVAPFSASAAKSAPFSAPASTPFKAPSPFKAAISGVEPVTPSTDVPASPVFATPKPAAAESRSQPPSMPVVPPRSAASFNVSKPFSAPASFQSALALSQRSEIELDRKPAVTMNVGGNAWAGEASQVSKHLFRPAGSLLDPAVVAPPALATASIPTFSLAARIRASNQSSDLNSNPTTANVATKASTPPPPSLLCLLKRPSDENRTSDNLPNKRPFISSLLSKP
jgi:ATP-dependent exoDNAse (exonuclease V) beta subunit